MSMTQAEIDDFLEGVHLARVATVRPDGRPHVTPVWYLWQDGCFYFETEVTAVKAKNLRNNPHIAVTVDITGGGMRLKYVILEGRAGFIEEQQLVQELTERIYIRYVGREALPTPTIQEMLQAKKLIVKLTPGRVITMNTLKPTELSAL